MNDDLITGTMDDDHFDWGPDTSPVYYPCSACTRNSAPLGAECPECGHVNRATRFGDRPSVGGAS